MGSAVIRCHLSRLMGERKLKISDIARDTGLNRGVLTRMYYEKTERLELDVLDILCRFFNISVGELFEYVPGDTDTVVKTKFRVRRRTDAAEE